MYRWTLLSDMLVYSKSCFTFAVQHCVLEGILTAPFWCSALMPTQLQTLCKFTCTYRLASECNHVRLLHAILHAACDELEQKLHSITVRIRINSNVSRSCWDTRTGSAAVAILQVLKAPTAIQGCC